MLEIFPATNLQKPFIIEIHMYVIYEVKEADQIVKYKYLINLKHTL